MDWIEPSTSSWEDRATGVMSRLEEVLAEVGAAEPERLLSELRESVVRYDDPVDNRIALRSVELTSLHEDPADRIIVATALSLGARLVTRDRRLHAFDGVETVW